MRQILSLWRGLLYRLHCFQLSVEQCSSVLCMHTADCTIWSMAWLHANCIQRVKRVRYLTAYRIYALRHNTQLMFCRSCNSTIGLFEWLLLLYNLRLQRYCGIRRAEMVYYEAHHRKQDYRLLAVLAPVCKHALFRQRAGIDCNCCLQCLCLFRCFDSSGLGSDDDLHGDCRKFKRECRRRLMHKHRPMLQTNTNIILSPCNDEHDVIFAKGYCIIRPMGV